MEPKYTFTKSQLLQVINLVKEKKIDLDVMFMFLEGMQEQPQKSTFSNKVHNTVPVKEPSLEDTKKAIEEDFKKPPEPKSFNIKTIGDVTPKGK